MRKVLAVAILAALVFSPTLVLAQASPYPLIASATLQSAASALGNGNTFDTSRFSTIVFYGFHTSGTTTVTFEASSDGVKWTALLACTPIGTASNASTMSLGTTQLMSRCVVTGVQTVRARISTCTTCVGATVYVSASSVPLGFND